MFKKLAQTLKFIFRPSYRIRNVNIFKYTYSEGDHKLTIYIDRSDGRLRLFSSQTVRWNPPYEDELISEEKRAEISQRLLKRFAWEKPYILDEPEDEEIERQKAVEARERKGAHRA